MREQLRNITDKPTKYGFVAVGSNLSTATRTSLQVAIEALGLFFDAEMRITQQSQWYSAPAFPSGSGPDYVNGVVKVSTTLSAAQVLAALHGIENQLGRTRPARWASRIVDLDLLDFDGDVQPDAMVYKRWKTLPLEAQMRETPEQLILPHPRLQDRSFVLKPLAEIAPDWQHPVMGLTATELLHLRPQDERDEITPL